MIMRALSPPNPEHLLSPPSATLSSIRNGGEGRREEALGFMGSFDDLKSRHGAMNRRSSERVLDCGGKQSATPLSQTKTPNGRRFMERASVPQTFPGIFLKI